MSEDLQRLKWPVATQLVKLLQVRGPPLGGQENELTNEIIIYKPINRTRKALQARRAGDLESP